MVKLEHILLGVLGVLFVIAFLAVTWWFFANPWVLFAAVVALVLLGIILIAAWYIFKPKPLQMNKQMARDVMEAALIGGAGISDYAGGLYLQGSSQGGGLRLGKITGHCIEQFQATIGATRTLVERDGIPTEEETGGFQAMLRFHYFAYKQDGLFAQLFGKPLLFAVWDYSRDGGKTWVEAHSALSGDVVLKGTTPVKVNEYFWLDTQAWSPVVDRYMSLKAQRTENHLTLNDIDVVVKAAMKADASHQKAMERDKLIDSGTPLGGGAFARKVEYEE
jgi:hypothetical protein